MPPKITAEEAEADDVLHLLKGLADDASGAYEAFKKKLAAGALADPNALAVEVGELFSIMADVSQYAFQAHFEHFEWAAQVDDDLDELKGMDGTTILPEDAAKLKGVILVLAQNLRAASSPDDEALLATLKQQAAEAVAFIDEATAEETDEEDDDEAQAH